MNYLIDTCVISEYLRKQPEQQVIDWLDRQDESTLFLSSLTIAELNKGCYKLRYKKESDRARAAKIGPWIDALEARFDGRIVDIKPDILDFWADLCGRSEAKGRKLPVMDSLIVATAKMLNMTAVTRNVHDFRNCSDTLEIWNPYVQK